eukprot:g3573.t1
MSSASPSRVPATVESLLSEVTTSLFYQHAKPGKGVFLSDLERRVGQEIQKRLEGTGTASNGLSSSRIQQQIMVVVNELSDARRLKCLERMKPASTSSSSQPELHFELHSDEHCQKLQSLTPDEFNLYYIIEEAQQKGLWTKDIRTKLGKKNVNKLCKSLENKKLIKFFKPIKTPSRKFFILYSLKVPDELGGGVFYQNQQYDKELIAICRLLCLSYLTRAPAGTLTASALRDRINGSGLLKNTKLKLDDVRKILNTLLLDGQIDTDHSSLRGKHIGLGMELFYDNPAFEYDWSRGLDRYWITNTGISPNLGLPCSRCTLVKKCSEGTVLNPLTCTYYERYLEAISARLAAEKIPSDALFEGAGSDLPTNGAEVSPTNSSTNVVVGTGSSGLKRQAPYSETNKYTNSSVENVPSFSKKRRIGDGGTYL